MIKTINQNAHALVCDIDANSHDFPWSSQALAASLADHQALGYFENSQLLAFVIYREVLDEAEILHLVCRRDQQRKGIANRLLGCLIEKLGQAQIRQLFLEVREHNIAAIALYQKLGFVTYANRKQYYRNQDNALLMRLDLQQLSENKS